MQTTFVSRPETMNRPSQQLINRLEWLRRALNPHDNGALLVKNFSPVEARRCVVDIKEELIKRAQRGCQVAYRFTSHQGWYGTPLQRSA